MIEFNKSYSKEEINKIYDKYLKKKLVRDFLFYKVCDYPLWGTSNEDIINLLEKWNFESILFPLVKITEIPGNTIDSKIDTVFKQHDKEQALIDEEISNFEKSKDYTFKEYIKLLNKKYECVHYLYDNKVNHLRITPRDKSLTKDITLHCIASSEFMVDDASHYAGVYFYKEDNIYKLSVGYMLSTPNFDSIFIDITDEDIELKEFILYLVNNKFEE